MSAQHEMQNPGDPPVDITDFVLAPGIGEDGFSLETHAEEGSVGSSEVVFDDPDGTFYPIGLNAYRVRETESEADDPLLYVGAFGARVETRGPYRTGASRHVRAQVQDANSGLSRYVVRADEDGDRPEETETERMEWLFTTSGMALHWDISTSIIVTGSTVLSAANLTDYTPQQILDDMAQQTGKNYFVFIDGAVDPPEALLVYAPDSGDHLTSDLRFSNVIEDVDDETTFFAGLDWEQEINPERVASYISVRYANGRVDESDSDTADVFSRIDKVQDAPLIKTAGVATTRALEYLDDLGSEETTLTGTVYLPAAKASQFRAGMRVEMKASHLTGLTSFSWVRLLSVTIVNISLDPTLTYALAFEGTFSPPMSCSTVLAGLVAQEDGGTQSGGLGSHSDDDAGGPVAPGVAPYLAFAFMMMYEPHGTSMTDITVDSPWTAGTGKPGVTGGTHTETMVAWRKDAAGTPNFVITGICDYWRQFGVVVQTAATSPTELAIGGGGVITGATPGRMVLVFRMAEGPTGWGTDPVGADWVLLEDLSLEDIIQTQANMQIWACCVPEDTSGMGAGQAGSSHWIHAWEMDIS